MYRSGPGGKTGKDGRELSGLICGNWVEKRICKCLHDNKCYLIGGLLLCASNREGAVVCHGISALKMRASAMEERMGKNRKQSVEK